MNDCKLIKKLDLLTKIEKNEGNESGEKVDKFLMKLNIITVSVSFIVFLVSMMLPVYLFKFESILLFHASVVFVFFAKGVFINKNNQRKDKDETIFNLFAALAGSLVIGFLSGSIIISFFNYLSKGGNDFNDMLIVHLVSLMVATFVSLIPTLKKVNEHKKNKNNDVKKQIHSINREMKEKYKTIDEWYYAELIANTFKHMEALPFILNEKSKAVKAQGFSSFEEYQVKKVEFDIKNKNNVNTNNLIND